jgi:hypothetical protein
MGRTKDLFIQLREAENNLPEIYLKSKKEVKQIAADTATEIINSGNYNLIELFANTIRLNEFLNEVNKEIKEKLKEKIDGKENAFGIEFQIVNGASRPNYKEDDEWLRINSELKERENLLKLALKSEKPIYDSDGAEVPRVSVIGGKETIKITY